MWVKLMDDTGVGHDYALRIDGKCGDAIKPRAK